MAHHHVTSADIAINGDHLDPSKVSKVKNLALGVAVVGSVVSLYLLFFGPVKLQGTYAYSWLFAFYFFLTLSIGGFENFCPRIPKIPTTSNATSA